MSLVVLIALVPVVLVVSLLVPALAVQFALHYWYRPALRISLEEAWSARFESRLREFSATVASAAPLRE